MSAGKIFADMAHHLIVVEGSHDAAFFGRLLFARGFREVRNLRDLPAFWLPLIPRNFPARADLQLERLMPFPEIMTRPGTDDTVGIEVARGDSGLLDALRTVLDVNEAGDFASLSLVLDTDWEITEAERFEKFSALLAPWNDRGSADDRPGFPLAFPAAPNSIRRGPPHIGIYLLPGGGAQGTLESILLGCAELEHSDIHKHASAIVEFVAQSAKYPPEVRPDALKRLRKPAGKAKAQCGIIGNIFNPGSSLSVSLRESPWFPASEDALPALKAAGAFIDDLLAP